MRPVEFLLVVADLLTFVVGVVPRLHTARWMWGVVLITLSLAVVQVLLEGPRWQLGPAYTLTLVFFLLWLLSMVIPGGVPVNRLVALLGAGVGVLMLVLSIALPMLLPVFHFPQPTGPYAIGTLTYHWVDMSRPELFTTAPNSHRELMAQVWYPATDEPSAPRAPYMQDAAALTPALARVTHFPRFFLTHLTYVTTHAVASAPIAATPSSYPVLIFLSGTDGFRASNTFQIEELISHGYIVVGLDQPGAAATVRFPDGRQLAGWSRDALQPLIVQSVEPQPTAPTVYGKALPDGIIPYLAQDVSFALDQLTALNQADPHHILTGHLDLERIGIFGISLGGMNAAEACMKDRRLKACLMMDVYMPADVVKAGLHQPGMFITRNAATMRLEGWSEQDIALTLDTMRTVYRHLPGEGYYVEIPKMFHLNFTDAPYWSPITSLLGLTGPIDGQRGCDIVKAYSVAFFEKELKGQSSSLLNELSHQYPEVHVQTRGP